LITLKKLT